MSSNNHDIAIIGMASHFPGASSYWEYWKNLQQARSGIREVPPERWDWKLYWDDAARKDKTSKWAGFVNDADCFDAAFFNHSGKEAESMDPQQRLMLQLSWHCLEDAGIPPSLLSGSNTGVYLGVFNFDYRELQEQSRFIEAHHATGTSPAIIANRISYYYNFRGPSVPVDTACSASLQALHLAAQSIRSGECDLAFAGGVSLLFTPTRFISMSKAAMLSPTGACKTFDDSADGYVRGEGGGLLLLKPLKKALEDGNIIHGVLKGSAVNHGGKAHTLTYPRPEAQAEVIIAAMKRAGVSPDMINYVEAHGTGTPKGDPVEFEGLVKAFTTYAAAENKTLPFNYCGLGSVKSNIGHLESAAGVAGIIKVLLAMKHRQLPALLHFERLNQRIKLEQTPFYITDKLQEWKPLKDANGQALPRTAGISSFGFGGTNAHVILQEPPPPKLQQEHARPAFLICLSAKTATALEQKIKELATWIDAQEGNIRLSDISYTLLLGRDHFPVRKAFVVKDLPTLRGLLANERRSHTAQQQHTAALSANMDEAIAAVYQEQDAASIINRLATVATLYEQGYEGQWTNLFEPGEATCIPLPAYPFAKTRYWIPSRAASAPAQIHPLLHEDTATTATPRFTSVFTGEEHFLKDHVINGNKILPGVAYLEMVRAAMQQAFGKTAGRPLTIRIKNVVWAVPFIASGQAQKLHITLSGSGTAPTTFEVYTQDEERKKTVHGQGTAILEPVAAIPSHDLDALRHHCRLHTFEKATFYALLRKAGFEYGPSHQAIEQLYVGQQQLLARLSLPQHATDNKDAYILHPGYMDAALQASMGWLMKDTEAGSQPKLLLPFALQELQIFDSCKSPAYAVIRYSKGSSADAKVQQLDIDLCDNMGKVCVSMSGYCGRLMESAAAAADSSNAADVLRLRSHWKERISTHAAAPVYEAHTVILCEADPAAAAIVNSSMKGLHCHALRQEAASIDKKLSAYGGYVLETIQRLVKEGPKGKILLQVLVPHEGASRLLSALSGMLRTASLEYPRIIAQLIEWPAAMPPAAITTVLQDNMQHPDDVHIRYDGSGYKVKAWQEIDSSPVAKLPWKESGVYLITGGTGGLGYIFAKEIAARTNNVTLILTGRTTLSATKQMRLQQLEETGARIVHRLVDMNDETAVYSLFQWIKDTHGRVDGIFHGAGIIRDNFIMRKTRTEMDEVLGPKVPGLLYLDEASKDMAPDFLVLFSSFVGAMGNAGQADYALANSFMDEYAHYRNSLVKQGKRKGSTVSVNWPLWKEGGMQVDAASEKNIWISSGIMPMATTVGIETLYAALLDAADQLMVLQGDTERLRKKLLTSPITGTSPAPPVATAVPTLQTAGLISLLIQYTAEILKISVADIDPVTAMDEYGFDSILYVEFTNKLNDTFGLELAPTVFFEYPNLEALAGYIAAQGVASPATTSEPHTAAPEPTAPLTPSVPPLAGPVPVAVIGISGKFPMAEDINALWQNLVGEKDCISEIPAARWDWQLYDNNAAKEGGRSKMRWGGFMDDINAFDPSFFNISPAEAAQMDPQQRLLLMHAWKAIEDAGYAPQQFSGTNTAVFAGMANHEYSGLFSTAGAPIEAYTSTGIISCVGPNRISYLLNLHGPSEPVETACSSSLVAIHRAVRLIQEGDCDMALAGGVNALLTPQLYIGFGKAGMLSEDGRCHTFSDKANGYVRGEGVGMLVLKRLEDAERDGDHIYGVIRSTAENHGGRANSLTAPGVQAQAALLKAAYSKAGIDPRTVSYIEAHGTGTKLGDPIEVEALKAAFAGLYEASGDTVVTAAHCGLGSVKTNIGHLEYAAGVAGIIKVLLQVKHRKLPKSLHCDNVNPYIRLDNSPFYIVQQTQEWKAVPDASGRELPRRAGVSSFGFGGVNAHVIIEEYLPQRVHTVIAPQPGIFILSAKNEERLKAQAAQLLSALHEQQYDDSKLADIAYTLQAGRNAMEERLAITARNIQELQQKLTTFTTGGNIVGLYRGQVKKQHASTQNIPLNELQRMMSEAPEQLAELWTKGQALNWELLYPDAKPRRISLPTYPFAKEYVGLSAPAAASVNTSPAMPAAPPPVHQAAVTHSASSESITETLIRHVAAMLKISSENIALDVNLDEYGFDSLLFTQFANELNEALGLDLTPTLFFEYQNLGELASYLQSAHGERLATAPSPTPANTATLVVTRPADPSTIAVIGMSGEFPMAGDIDTFWQNLLEEKDCIAEIPADRWNWKEYPGAGARWGGFIEGMSTFDPLFFNISPAEALYMDPQHRLLMMHIWKALEDAGYAPHSLGGSNTAIFAGMANLEYDRLLTQSGLPVEGYSSTGMMASLGPARMSYFLDLHGPSEPVETACSSSLVAIHRAVEAIRSGSCSLAIAGGMNTLLTPELFQSLCQAGMLSEDGRCKTFSDRANGYVRGEGAAVIVLKRLEDAEHDGDHIYGLIRSTAINHGGHANSLTAPNPKAQSQLLQQAYHKAGIDPRSISYIEAHGTGTKLGDPIEIDALKHAFSELYHAGGIPPATRAHCGIGSVKTNIGHLELAAGVAGVIKVLLQLQHKTLVKSLHSDTINPYIRLDNSPFYIVQQTKPWEPVHDEQGLAFPRRAGVSSFGFGGVNAHVVIEEYIAPAALKNTGASDSALIVLSARNKAGLTAYAAGLLNAVSKGGLQEEDLHRIAFTLQAGRDHMQERLAILAGSLLQLGTALENFLAGKNISDISWQGSVNNNKTGEPGAPQTINTFTVHEWISQRRYDAIAMHWVNGGTVDWPSLYGPVKPRRISLPTYPFARKPYWVRARREQATAAATAVHKINATVTLANITDGQLKEQALSYFRTKLEEMLMIPAEEIAVDVPFEQYGADSIFITKLQGSLKRVCPGVNNQLFFEYPTLEELVNRLLKTERDGLRKLLNGEGQQQSPVQYPELIHLNDNTKGRPVFWMHPIGGGIESYRQIAEQSERPFYGISAAGWTDQNIALQGIPALAARYIDVIKSVQATGPYDLGGYSLGGALAYEMARQLQEAGDAVNTIIMLDAVYVPGVMERLELSYKSLVLQTANLLLQARASRGKGATADLIHRDELDLHLPDDEFLHQVMALARSKGLQKTAEQLNAIVQLTIQVQQACRFSDYRVSPLPDPSAVSCYYFRNGKRSFYGSLAPYCIISPQEDMPIADKDYWLAWQKLLPHFHLVDLDTSSHITLLQEAAALDSLFNCCATIYTSQQALLRQTAF